MNDNNWKISVDLSKSFIVLGEPITGNNRGVLNIIIKDSVKNHPFFSYTTDLKTTGLIFRNLTIRSSSLSNAKLNDRMEKQRVGVDHFAGNRFITCFSHSDDEIVPFWMNYGGNIFTDKVCLRFRNFSEIFTDCFYTDYGLVENNKKCLFKSSNYGNMINSQHNPGSTIAEEYDLRATISEILLLDVEYVSTDSDVFKKNHEGNYIVNFGKVGAKDTEIEVHGYDPTVLGKQKSKPWEYERETRILCNLGGSAFNEWSYIDLRLKPELFRGLCIILSPWDDGQLKGKVEKIIESSSLPEDIKNSIEIKDSVLKGTINIS